MPMKDSSPMLGRNNVNVRHEQFGKGVGRRHCQESGVAYKACCKGVFHPAHLNREGACPGSLSFVSAMLSRTTQGDM